MSTGKELGTATGTTGEGHWPVAITAGGRHELQVDEPAPEGGDTGAAPYSLLASGLAACTAITLKMYGERKGWDVGDVSVEATFVADEEGNQRIERAVSLAGASLEAEQRERLADIAEKTPVTKTLKRACEITTTWS